MSSMLVTGGAGFIGTNFVYYWQQKYPEDHIIVLDALTYAGNRHSLRKAEEKESFRFIHGSILDQELVEKLMHDYEIKKIVHFAAESHVDRSILGPDAFINTNIMGTHTLLKVAKKVWVDANVTDHRFHHVSTDEVYGSLGTDDAPFDETNQYRPNSPYAASKASSDHLVRAYHKTFGMNTTISNCSNNYGPFQFPEKLIPLIIVNILNNKPLPVYGDGCQIRDWLYVDDHSLGVDLILHKGQPGETYNIGGYNEWKNIDIVRHVCDFLDLKFIESPGLCQRFPDSAPAKGQMSKELITHVRDRAGHDRRYAINAGKINTALGFYPNETFPSAIEKTVDWFLENKSWWLRIMDSSYKEWVSSNYSLHTKDN